MMYKRSYRLLAWLLTIILVLNISPVSAFADDYAQSGTYGTKMTLDVTDKASVSASEGSLRITVPDSTELPKDGTSGFMVYTIPDGITVTAEDAAAMSNDAVACELSEDGTKLVFTWKGDKAEGFTASLPYTYTTRTPGDDQYIVRYMIKGDETYDGQDLRLAGDKIGAVSWSEFQQTSNKSGEKAAVDLETNVPSFAGTGNPKYDVDPDNRTLTFYYPATTGQIEIHYFIIWTHEDQNTHAQDTRIFTFQDVRGDNDAVGLDRDEILDGKKFLKKITGNENGGDSITLQNYTFDSGITTSIKKAIHFDLADKYIDIDDEVTSNKNKVFTLSYYGYTYNSEATNVSQIITEPAKPIHYTGEKDTEVLRLYYLLSTDGTIIKPATTEGNQPSAEPTTEPQGSSSTSSTYTVKYMLKGTETEIHEPLTNQVYLDWGVKTASAQPIEIDGYEFDGDKYNSVNKAQSELENDTIILYYTRALSTTYTVRYMLKGTETEIHEPLTNQVYLDWGVKTASAQPIEIDGYEFDGDKYNSVNKAQSELENDTIILYYKEKVTVTPVPNYTITWVDGDGKTLKTEQVAYGDTPAYTGDTPTKTATAQYTYAFDNTWSPAITKVTGEATYQASFTPETRSYDVIFLNEAGTEILRGTYLYGTEPADIETPAAQTKESTAEFDYNFNGWNVAKVTGEATYQASFTPETRSYDVIFLNEAGTEILRGTYLYGTAGSDISKPETNPQKTGYSFNGWDTIPESITDNTVIKATYSINQYTITFDVDGGSAVDAITQDYASAITKPKDPIKEGYTFDKWVIEDKEDQNFPTTMPAENLKITALWTINSYNLVYKVDGTEYNKSTVNYGTKLAAIDAPTKTGYNFSGWSEVPATMPAEDVEVNGNFTVNSYSYTIHHYLLDTELPVSEDETGTVEYGSTINATIAETFDGKALKVAEAATPTRSVSITEKAENNVITIFYTLDLEVKAEILSRDYNGQPLNGVYTITGALADDVETIKTALGTAPSITTVAESTKAYLTEEEQLAITGIPKYYVTKFTSGSLEITKATMDLTANGFNDQYDGKAHGVTVNTLPDGTKVEYSADNGKTWSETSPTVTNVEDGTIRVQVRATNANYKDAMTEAILLKVNPRKVSITPDDKEMTYGDEEDKIPSLSATPYNVVEGETLDYTLTREKSDTFNAGSYKISVELGKNPNYDITTETGTYLINKKRVSITADSFTKAWGVDDPEFTATVDGLVGDDQIKYIVRRVAGEWAVTAVSSTDDNTIATDVYRIYIEADEDQGNYYVAADELIDGTLTIKKTPVTIESPLDKLGEDKTVYSGMIVKLTAMMTGLDEYPDNYTFQWQVAPTEDGTYNDIPGANGRTYSYVLNKDTIGQFYRVVITLKK